MMLYAIVGVCQQEDHYHMEFLDLGREPGTKVNILKSISYLVCGTVLLETETGQRHMLCMESGSDYFISQLTQDTEENPPPARR
jgi:hypothetical protein